MKKGKVILVGAGPGDPGLLTVKGKSALETAEVVVYDRLVSKEILDMIPEHAERINVGKESSHHLVPQEEINRILLQKGQEGKRVVRLKGGDPFMFGRGGEELELLAQNGIEFEEIPGITSAIAVPAYGGIPVTHRDFCSSLHIVTGHQRAGLPLNIPFESLVQTGGTLVFLMGVSALANICSGLQNAGMPEDMPAAVVEKGTTAQQRVILADLATLPERAKNEHVTSPAVIIVGRVCSLSQQFDWFDHLPLKGKRIIVTRPKDRAGRLSSALRALGADVTEFPCIETIPYDPCNSMKQAINMIDTYEWLAFTSPAGVAALMRMLKTSGKDVRALGRIKLAAIGPGTNRELGKYGLNADLIPDIYDGEHLGKALAGVHPSGRVLILRAEWGTPALTQKLENAGIVFDDIRCYKTDYTGTDSENIRRILSEENPVVTFTSASTVRGFVRALGKTDGSLFTAVCIGKQTEAEAQKNGFQTITAKEATMDSLIERITEGV